jgi:DNA-binding NarL/FixJ family response regulator
VLVVDPHRLVRQELADSLGDDAGIEIVASVADGGGAIEAYRRLKPDVVVTELALPAGDGHETTRRIVAEDPKARVVIHTALAQARHVLGAFDAGAVGYLLKGLRPDELVERIREAAQGGSPITADAAAVLVAERRRGRPEAALSSRERDVLLLIAQGLTNKAIAARLQISEKTVKVHVSRILSTLRVTDRTQAALWVHVHRVQE